MTFFSLQFTFSNFYLDFYFPFFLGLLFSLFSLDFYFPFFLGLLFSLWTFIQSRSHFGFLPNFWFEPEFRLDFRVLPGRALRVKKRVGSGRPQNGYKFGFKPNMYLLNPIEPDFGLGPKSGQLRSAPGVKNSGQFRSGSFGRKSECTLEIMTSWVSKLIQLTLAKTEIVYPKNVRA